MLERIRFRRWWKPPRATSDRPEERRVTYLELFYDLVYVVIIAELSHSLSEEISLAKIGTFSFLFIIVWWAWFNGAMYHDLHGNNDIRTRVFTFLQMFTVAALAVYAHDALGTGSAGFALAYAAFHLILTWLWWRTGVHDRHHRPVSQPYSLTLLVTALAFTGSIFVSTPWRFWMWGLALFMDLIMLLLLITSDNTAIRAQLDRTMLISPSAVERFGLFTIIVLGEVIVGVVSGVAAQHDLSWLVKGTAVLGMMIAIGLWWVYFDFVAGRPPAAGPAQNLAWVYLHLPVAIGTTAVGASVLNVVEHAGENLPQDVRWLLVGAVAAVLFSISLIMRIIGLPEDLRRFYRTGSTLTLLSGFVLLLLCLAEINTIPLLLAILALMLIPIVYGILIWVKVFDAEEMQP
jgi:low temperature requirement protein LtrA